MEDFSKYFNKGNDCDMCKHQYMTGQDGTIYACRRDELGLQCDFEEIDDRSDLSGNVTKSAF
jgi:hypothetical protein